MKYEVIKIKKQFRYHVTVMATPDKWWEKYLLFKKTSLLQYQGTENLWVDNNYNFAPKKIGEAIDIKFNEEFKENSFIKFFDLAIAAIRRHTRFPPFPPPFTGKK